jgi:integrase/recombinase XerD
MNQKYFARITIDRKRTEINSHQTIHADYWDPEKQCVVGSRELINHINPILEEMQYKLKDCYHQLILKSTFITGDSIKKLYFGDTIPYSSLMSLFEYHAATTKGILKSGTLKNYGATEKYIRAFL